MTQADPMWPPAIMDLYHLPKCQGIPSRTIETKVSETNDVKHHPTLTFTLVSVWIYGESIK